MKSRPPAGYLCAKLAAALLCTGSFALAQDNSASSQNDISALKAQVQSLQKQQQQYQDRISEMEGQMKAMESKAESGSILNTRILTDADGKEVAAAPTLDESFLKSLTRNFTFSAYVRAGFQFNGNGGGGNFSFELPSEPGGRERLGNENDTYFELTWMQSHMLGDSPDVMDVSMTFTPAIRYVQQRNTFQTAFGGGAIERGGNDFDFVMRQAFLSASNIFKNAPEITVWGGQRFYDRFNTDPDDYFWLDTSGYGVGVQNINAGIGQLNIAWIGGLDASNISPGIGSYFKHTFDVRLEHINLGVGSLALVLIGNVEKGGTFNQTYTGFGSTTTLTNPVHTNTAWGIGGGAIYNVNFGPGGGNNSFTAYALFGRGITNFGAGADTGAYSAAESLFLHYHPNTPAGQIIDVGDALDHGFTYRAGFQAYFALPWTHAEPAPVAGMSKDGKAVAPPAPAPAPAKPWFSVGLWANWNDSYNGSAIGGFTGPGVGLGGNVASPGTPITSKVVSGHAHWVDFGTRPAFWITDNIAIQGQFSGIYESNTNTSAVSGFPGFGHSGWMGVFDIGPVIKPKGGYYTRPEIRFFATYAIWSEHLKGVADPIQEGGGVGGGAAPPYNGNTTHGWLFGTQAEWYF